MKRFKHLVVTGLISLAVLIGGTPTPVRSQQKIIKIDGSSTVYPITEAVVEKFQKMKNENLLSSNR